MSILDRFFKGESAPVYPTGGFVETPPLQVPPLRNGEVTILRAGTSVLNSSKEVAVDRGYHWQKLDSCPAGVKCQLLTRFGIAIYGQYKKGDAGIVAWAPLPTIPPEIKELLK